MECSVEDYTSKQFAKVGVDERAVTSYLTQTGGFVYFSFRVCVKSRRYPTARKRDIDRYRQIKSCSNYQIPDGFLLFVCLSIDWKLNSDHEYRN